MDAHNYLKAQGWRGTGHTLHPTDNSIGLSQRLLVSQKRNTLGVGKKQHHTSDQWWMNAFDKSLKGLGVQEDGQGVAAAKTGALEVLSRGTRAWKWIGEGGGLYGNFVKGAGLAGSIGTDIAEEGGDGRRRKRARSVDEPVEQLRRSKKSRTREDNETKEERRARREARKLRKAARGSGTATPALEGRDVDDRPADAGSSGRTNRTIDTSGSHALHKATQAQSDDLGCDSSVETSELHSPAHTHDIESEDSLPPSDARVDIPEPRKKKSKKHKDKDEIEGKKTGTRDKKEKKREKERPKPGTA